MNCVVSAQVGQCGNQFWHSVLEKLNKVDDSSVHDTFFRGSVARALLLDTEEKVWRVFIVRCTTLFYFSHKVIKACLKKSKTEYWSYGQKMVLKSSSGTGNNWASGFNCMTECKKDVLLNLFRKEFENCPRISGILLIHGIAGGTGSGLGSHLTESLKDYLDSKPIANG